MGKFDGYLICSDLDGTFSVETVPVRKNIDAVKYFIQNGGRFSFATGRTAQYLRNTEMFPLINAPVCVCNGSAVYDYKTESVLKEGTNNFTLKEFLDAIGTWRNKMEGMYIYYSHKTDQAPNTADFEFPADELSKKPIKVVCAFANPKDIKTAEEFKIYCQNHPVFKTTYVSNSWVTGVEFNSIDSTKGSGVKFIKEYMEGIHTVAAIGDYDNDVSMIKAADIGASPVSGIESAKKEADIILCDVKDGAVAHLIEILEAELLNSKFLPFQGKNAVNTASIDEYFNDERV